MYTERIAGPIPGFSVVHRGGSSSNKWHQRHTPEDVGHMPVSRSIQHAFRRALGSTDASSAHTEACHPLAQPCFSTTSPESTKGWSYEDGNVANGASGKAWSTRHPSIANGVHRRPTFCLQDGAFCEFLVTANATAGIAKECRILEFK